MCGVQRLGCPHRVREGSPRARMGWRGFLAGSGVHAQPPAHEAEDVQEVLPCQNA